MIKRILLPLDFSKYSDAALQYACYIAKRQEAEITGMVVVHVPGIVMPIGPLLMGVANWSGDMDQHAIEDVNDSIRALLRNFHQVCKREGVQHSETEVQGTTPDQIMFQSIFYDLVIMGFRTSYSLKKQDVEISLDSLLSHSITPVLAVPLEFKPIKKVLLAFDGSMQAARAMQRFSHLARVKDAETTVLMSHPEQDTASYYLNKAEEYLKAHGLNSVKKEWTNKNIITVIRDQYLNEVDMVITGVHSKGLIKDFVLGSLTKFLISEAKKPLFLGQ